MKEKITLKKYFKIRKYHIIIDTLIIYDYYPYINLCNIYIILYKNELKIYYLRKKIANLLNIPKNQKSKF